MIASFGTPTTSPAAIGADSNKQGTNTGDGVWYTGDFTTADQVVACALQQKLIDPRQIYVMGASAGALETTGMSYARSGYVAAVATLSGGLTGIGTTYPGYLGETTLQDASHVPPALAIHGATGSDVVAMDFSLASAAWEADIKSKGGFSVDCNTGGGHVSGPPATDAAILQFFQDHPFGAVQNYTGGLPSSFPSYCHVGPRLADGGV
jgi:poly(3-hydroxybutyrate) depolymerase